MKILVACFVIFLGILPGRLSAQAQPWKSVHTELRNDNREFVITLEPSLYENSENNPTIPHVRKVSVLIHSDNGLLTYASSYDQSLTVDLDNKEETSKLIGLIADFRQADKAQKERAAVHLVVMPGLGQHINSYNGAPGDFTVNYDIQYMFPALRKLPYGGFIQLISRDGDRNKHHTIFEPTALEQALTSIDNLRQMYQDAIQTKQSELAAHKALQEEIAKTKADQQQQARDLEMQQPSPGEVAPKLPNTNLEAGMSAQRTAQDDPAIAAIAKAEIARERTKIVEETSKAEQQQRLAEPAMSEQQLRTSIYMGDIKAASELISNKLFVARQSPGQNYVQLARISGLLEVAETSIRARSQTYITSLSGYAPSPEQENQRSAEVAQTVRAMYKLKQELERLRKVNDSQRPSADQQTTPSSATVAGDNNPKVPEAEGHIPKTVRISSEDVCFRKWQDVQDFQSQFAELWQAAKRKTQARGVTRISDEEASRIGKQLLNEKNALQAQFAADARLWNIPIGTEIKISKYSDYNGNEIKPVWNEPQKTFYTPDGHRVYITGEWDEKTAYIILTK